MGKASSAKKVARAARAGGSRRPGQRRQLGFPAILVGVVAVGSSLVVFARSSRESNAEPRSQAHAEFDHWHAAVGVYDCDHFVYDGSEEGGPFFTDLADDPLGIHTHGDGVIHIHPFTDAAGGRNARMTLWFQDIGLDASDSKITFPDGTVWDESTKKCGTDSDATSGEIVLAVWNSAQDAADGERPSELITEDFGDVRFREDRQYFTLAFVPEDDLDSIPARSGIMETLNNLSDVPPEENIDAPTSTETTIADESGSSTSTTSASSDSTTSTSAASG